MCVCEFCKSACMCVPVCVCVCVSARYARRGEWRLKCLPCREFEIPLDSVGSSRAAATSEGAGSGWEGGLIGCVGHPRSQQACCLATPPRSSRKGCSAGWQRCLLVTYRWQRSRSALAIVLPPSLPPSFCAYQRLPHSSWQLGRHLLLSLPASFSLSFPPLGCSFFAHIYFILLSFHWRHSLWQTDLFRCEISIYKDASICVWV